MAEHREIDPAALEARVIALARELDPGVEVIRIDPDLADTAVFCETYGYTLEESANCIVVVAKSGQAASPGPRTMTACMVQATRRLDLNRHARALVGARKASFAPQEETVERTRMIPGGVTPIGLPEGIDVVIDAPIMELDRVIVGGGGRGVKLYLSPAALAAVPNARVAEIGR